MKKSVSGCFGEKGIGQPFAVALINPVDCFFFQNWSDVEISDSLASDYVDQRKKIVCQIVDGFRGKPTQKVCSLAYNSVKKNKEELRAEFNCWGIGLLAFIIRFEMDLLYARNSLFFFACPYFVVLAPLYC